MMGLASIAALTAAAIAQTAADTNPLDLPTALRLAQENNLELKSARLKRAQALAGIRAAGQLPNPVFGFTAARDTPHEGVTLDQSIEIGGKRGARIAVAQQEARATDIEIVTLERQVRRRTREAYFRYAAAVAQQELARQGLDLSRRLQQIAQDRYDAGDVPQLEVIQADVETARSEVDQQAAAQATRSASAQLLALINQPSSTLPALPGTFPGPPFAPELSALIAKASAENPEIQRTTQEIEIERRRAQLLRATRIPNLDLQFGTDFNAPPDFRVGPKGAISIGIPLFSRNQGELAQSSAAQSVLQASLDASRRNVAALVEAAYYDMAAKQAAADSYRTNLLPKTEKLAQMAEESYRAGKSNILILLDAQRKLQDVRKAYVDSQAALQISFAGLEETVGAPLD